MGVVASSVLRSVEGAWVVPRRSRRIAHAGGVRSGRDSVVGMLACVLFDLVVLRCIEGGFVAFKSSNGRGKGMRSVGASVRG